MNHKKKKSSKQKFTGDILEEGGLNPDLLLNRELSWLQFNGRVLEEAIRPENPLLERAKFLSIYTNNLDEFFMIRVSGLRRLLASGNMDLSPDGMSPAEQLDAIRKVLVGQLARQEHCWHKELQPALSEAGITVLRFEDATDAEVSAMKDFFEREVFPVLTPLAFDPAHPFPHISNLSLNLAVLIKDDQKEELFARIKVPDLFPRFVELPQTLQETEESTAAEIIPSHVPIRNRRFVMLEEIIAANLDRLFMGMNVVSAYPFRMTRDADLTIEEDEASDLLAALEEGIEMREWGSGVRLEIDRSMPPRLRELLITNLGIPSYLVYACESPIGLSDVKQFAGMDIPSLKDQPFVPKSHPTLCDKGTIFESVRENDCLLYHPYDSFSPVVDFIREAAQDPKVLAIKQTLYRVGQKSPIVDALLEARENGKQVAVMVEVKARFDEEFNIAWGRKLEDEGVHVAYGLLGLKTHAKMCMVVRRETQGIVRYVHLGTGNYNPITARLYSDIGLFTSDEAIGDDISDLFNVLTGYSRRDSYRKLLVGPGNLRKEIVARIEREITRHKEHGDGHIAMKMNSLVDPVCIGALYAASKEGVRVELQIRGICCLRPGIPGVSENIRVTSIVGRFLEHSRIYYFRNGGDDEVYLGSADLMPRNLDRRIEILFPVESKQLKHLVINEILKPHLGDTYNNWELHSDGSYTRVPANPEGVSNSQVHFIRSWNKKRRIKSK